MAEGNIEEQISEILEKENKPTIKALEEKLNEITIFKLRIETFMKRKENQDILNNRIGELNTQAKAITAKQDAGEKLSEEDKKGLNHINKNITMFKSLRDLGKTREEIIEGYENDTMVELTQGGYLLALSIRKILGLAPIDYIIVWKTKDGEIMQSKFTHENVKEHLGQIQKITSEMKINKGKKSDTNIHEAFKAEFQFKFIENELNNFLNNKLECYLNSIGPSYNYNGLLKNDQKVIDYGRVAELALALQLQNITKEEEIYKAMIAFRRDSITFFYTGDVGLTQVKYSDSANGYGILKIYNALSQIEDLIKFGYKLDVSEKRLGGLRSASALSEWVNEAVAKGKEEITDKTIKNLVRAFVTLDNS